MPYVHIQITREGVTAEQKEALIEGTTDLLARVLKKNPAQTFVVIEEVNSDNWGIAGMTVTKYRSQESAVAQT
jgi:4-oxalocrotonate tautomerase